MFHFVSIISTRMSSYQNGFSGKNEHDAIVQFESWCVKHDVVWAHLFYQETGAVMRSYFKGRGLVDFEGCQ